MLDSYKQFKYYDYFSNYFQFFWYVGFNALFVKARLYLNGCYEEVVFLLAGFSCFVITASFVLSHYPYRNWYEISDVPKRFLCLV